VKLWRGLLMYHKYQELLKRKKKLFKLQSHHKKNLKLKI
jgi:hypothetical protein